LWRTTKRILGGIEEDRQETVIAEVGCAIDAGLSAERVGYVGSLRGEKILW
jgi:hypothetical protein